jgi:hypothetical protein
MRVFKKSQKIAHIVVKSLNASLTDGILIHQIVEVNRFYIAKLQAKG